MPDALVLVEREGPIATLALNRPERYNAFDPELIGALDDAFHRETERDATHAVVLTGKGKAFCAGGDIRSMQQALDGDPKALFLTLTERLHPLVEAIRACPKPVVAAVNGPVAGGGFGLALACDWRTASETATFRPAYAQLGIVPDGGLTFFLPRLAGWGVANRVILADLTVDAAKAHAWGLVDEVVAPDKVVPGAVATARRLAQLPEGTFERTKRLLDQSLFVGLADQLAQERKWNAESAAGDALKEGVAAFLGKRAPVFRRP